MRQIMPLLVEDPQPDASLAQAALRHQPGVEVVVHIRPKITAPPPNSCHR